jgi:hypothetical protein
MNVEVNGEVYESEYPPDAPLTREERQKQQTSLEAAVERKLAQSFDFYNAAVQRVNQYVKETTISPVELTSKLESFPGRIAGIGREILDLLTRQQAINEQWGTLTIHLKQEIATETVLVAQRSGGDTEKPAYANEEARQTELNFRLSQMEGYTDNMAEVAAIDRAVKELRILQDEVTRHYEVARARREQSNAELLVRAFAGYDK